MNIYKLKGKGCTIEYLDHCDYPDVYMVYFNCHQKARNGYDVPVTSNKLMVRADVFDTIYNGGKLHGLEYIHNKSNGSYEVKLRSKISVIEFTFWFVSEVSLTEELEKEGNKESYAISGLLAKIAMEDENGLGEEE